VDIEKNEEADSKIVNFPTPMWAQIEVLHELGKAREEGLDKALEVAATGIGKSVLVENC